MEFDMDLSGEALEAFKAKRFQSKNAEIDSLLDLTIKYVLKNSKIFVGRVENPFQNLPNTIVQRFFFILTEQMIKHDAIPILVINLENYPLVYLLLNKNVEEFGMKERFCRFHNYHDQTDEKLGLIFVSDSCFLHHALEHCTNWRRACVWLETFTEGIAMKMSTNWQKLKILTLACKCVIQDSVIGLLRKYLPQIEDLDLIEFDGTSEFIVLHRFTWKGVHYFSQMKQLKVLSFQLDYYSFDFSNIIWAHVAGRIPNLKKLNFSRAINGMPLCDLQFARHYEKLYPDKMLQLNTIKLSNQFRSDWHWPNNLTVDCLHIESLSSMSALHFIPKTVKALVITRHFTKYYKEPSAHEAVEILGSTITSLTFYCNFINVNRLLSACPVLDDFKFEGCLTANDTRIDLLTPQRFKDFNQLSYIDRFCCSGPNDACGGLFQLFLMGSDRFCKTSTLRCSCDHRLRATLEVLRLTDNNCKYYRNLKEIDLMSSYFEEPKEDIFELFYRLIANCPFLQKVSISYLQEERYNNDLDKQKNFVNKSLKLRKFANNFHIQCLIKVYSYMLESVTEL